VIDLHHARVNTAGAYVSIHGLYPFAIGAVLHHGHIPIFRLGGHREADETGWQCAIREVYEETGLRIRFVTPHATYWADTDLRAPELQEIQWDDAADQDNIPLLVVSYRREGKTLLSLMYQAEADELPVPSAEVQGLLLLDKENIHWLCQEPRTLEQYLSRGGKAIITGDFDRGLFLEPFIQLRLFSRILAGGS